MTASSITSPTSSSSSTAATRASHGAFTARLPCRGADCAGSTVPEWCIGPQVLRSPSPPSLAGLSCCMAPPGLYGTDCCKPVETTASEAPISKSVIGPIKAPYCLRRMHDRLVGKQYLAMEDGPVLGWPDHKFVIHRLVLSPGLVCCLHSAPPGSAADARRRVRERCRQSRVDSNASRARTVATP